MQTRPISRRGLGRAAVALLCSLPLLTACSRALATDGILTGSGDLDLWSPLSGTFLLTVQQTGTSISGTASILTAFAGIPEQLDFQITSGDIAGDMFGDVLLTSQFGTATYPNVRLFYSTNGGTNGLGVIGYEGTDLGSVTYSIKSGVIELTLTPSYSISLLYDPSRSVKSGAAYPIRIQVLNASGDNLSSADLAVTALRFVQKDGMPDGDLQDTGNANPTFGFRYDASLGGYLYNVDTRGLTSGTYTVQFTVGSSSQLFEATFNVK
jgi:hypothetical protein